MTIKQALLSHAQSTMQELMERTGLLPDRIRSEITRLKRKGLVREVVYFETTERLLRVSTTEANRTADHRGDDRNGVRP